MSSRQKKDLVDTRIYEKALSDVGAEDYDYHAQDWDDEHKYFVSVRWGRKFRGLYLDFGCGTGLVGKNLIVVGREVVGVDISRRMCIVAKRKHGIQAVVADGLHLPFKNYGFSVVCVSGVLHHLRQQLGEVFAELGRCSSEAICIIEPSSTPPLIVIRVVRFFNKVYDGVMFQMLFKHRKDKYTFSVYEGPVDPLELERLCVKNSFKVVEVRFFNHVPGLRKIRNERLRKHLINSLISLSHGSDVEIIAERF
jgi:SAM-dependent methyltransferase